VGKEEKAPCALKGRGSYAGEEGGDVVKGVRVSRYQRVIVSERHVRVVFIDFIRRVE
jgi:hypothetical protein